MCNRCVKYGLKIPNSSGKKCQKKLWRELFDSHCIQPEDKLNTHIFVFPQHTAYRQYLAVTVLWNFNQKQCNILYNIATAAEVVTENCFHKVGMNSPEDKRLSWRETVSNNDRWHRYYLFCYTSKMQHSCCCMCGWRCNCNCCNCNYKTTS